MSDARVFFDYKATLGSVLMTSICVLLIAICLDP